MKKTLFSIALALLMAIALVLPGCSGAPEATAEPAQSTDAPQGTTAAEAAPGSWAIYWYLCGSDLESGGGFATTDLQEMAAAALPENVTVVVQTGGSSQWQNDQINADYLERYVYGSAGTFDLVDQQPLASMGDPATLTSFLQYATTNYPAEHQMVLFWNHGGGSVTGAASDELFGGDALTLDEMNVAFGSVFEANAAEQPLELVGFDTCLMATIDTAKTFQPYAKYLVASEELEPGNGWNYTDWLAGLAANTQITGAELGTIICDSFYAGCEAAGTEQQITLSVTDLSKLDALFTAYDNIGKEALALACEDPAFFAEFARNAQSAENYGGNTRDEGFTNMVDLGHLVRNSSDILTENADAVLSALDECVVYKVNGPYRAESSGLSCYYSYNGDVEDFNGFAEVSESDAFKYLYCYEVSGELPEDGLEYISAMQYEEVQEIPTIESLSLGDFPLEVDDEGYAVLNIGPEAATMLSGVYFQLYYADVESDIMLLLGRDNNINADWENGVFRDNFTGVWGAIDGNLVYMELCEEGDDYNLYTVPVLLNGEEYNLSVAYTYADGLYTILGATQGIDEDGMADRNLVLIQPGDEITTIHYGAALSDESELSPVEVDTFTVTEDTVFEDIPMGDGMFILMYEMVDISGNTAYSASAVFTVEGETITTQVGE